MLAAETVEGGFCDPVLGGQEIFRAVMGAMAAPATIVDVPDLVAPPQPLFATAAAIACTLLDGDTSIWLDHVLATDAVRGWLTFQTGAQFAPHAADAQFALIGGCEVMPALDHFEQGLQDYPDRSATLILQVASLTAGTPLLFTGPGIKEEAAIAPLGLPARFADQWVANRARFPRGVDVIMAAPRAIACLPRTARLTTEEN